MNIAMMLTRLLTFGFVLSTSALPTDFSYAAASSYSYSSSDGGTTTYYYSGGQGGQGGQGGHVQYGAHGQDGQDGHNGQKGQDGKDGVVTISFDSLVNTPGSIRGRYYLGEQKHDAYNQDRFSGVPNAEIHLIDAHLNEKVAQTYTDHNGQYHFKDIAPNNNLYLFFLNPKDVEGFGDGYEWVTYNQDTSNKVYNDDGETKNFALYPGYHLTGMDAGIYCERCLQEQKSASIEGRYFVDKFGHGHESASQPGANSAVIWLFDNTKWAWKDMAFTDWYGNYHFDDLDTTSTYTLYVEAPQNIMGLGWHYTWNQVTNDVRDNKVLYTDRSTGFGKTNGFTCSSSSISVMNFGIHNTWW